MQQLRWALKAAVTWPPLNVPVTAALRATLPQGVRDRPALARYLPRAGVVEAAMPSGQTLRMWSRGDDGIASDVFWRGWDGHESETVKPFLQMAASARVTLDIGAHVGYFTVLASLANPAGRVYAFEPLARVRERLDRNVSLNGLRNVTCLPLAIGSTHGTAEFFHVEDGIPSSSSLSGAFMRSIVDNGRLATSRVDVITVDEFVADHGLAGQVDLLKMDTESTEDDVFRGMVETLASERPAIFCEVLQAATGQAIEAMIGPLGYEFFLLTEKGPVRTAHIRPDQVWRNFLFSPDGVIPPAP